MQRHNEILLFAGMFLWLDCFKECLINFVAFGALIEVVAHLRKELVHFFSGKLKIHVARQDLEEFRA